MFVTRLLARSVSPMWVRGVVVVLMAGCQGPLNVAPPEVITATGTLTYQGRPVANAQMTFHGSSPDESAFAITDSQGRFRCATNDSGSGIIPGDYLVTVVGPRGDLPKQYADPETSTLSISVADDTENVFPLELTD